MEWIVYCVAYHRSLVRAINRCLFDPHLFVAASFFDLINWHYCVRARVWHQIIASNLLLLGCLSSDPSDWRVRDWRGGDCWRSDGWRGNGHSRGCVVHAACDRGRVLASVVVVVAACEVARARNWQQLGGGARDERGEHENDDELRCHCVLVVCVCVWFLVLSCSVELFASVW